MSEETPQGEVVDLPAQTLERPGSEERLTALKDAFANVAHEAAPRRTGLASYLLIAAAGATMGVGGLYAYESVAARLHATPTDPGPAFMQPQPQSPRALTDPELRGRMVAYGTCADARAAGAAPFRRGDPGYGPHLDRDNDGIGCEPYRGR